MSSENTKALIETRKSTLNPLKKIITLMKKLDSIVHLVLQVYFSET